MTLVDANLLMYARDERSPFHGRARDWLGEQLRGSRRVALPWISLAAFVRIMTNQRLANPLTPGEAWSQVEQWLDVDVVWVPNPGPGHADILGGIITRHEVFGGLVTDAQLAALAIEHGLTIYSTDTDFARFSEARWINPIAA